MEPLTKQQLAQKRNYFKFRILGCYLGMPKEAITPEELAILGEIETLRDNLLNNFDDGSRKLGLNVRPKKDKFHVNG